MGDYRDNGDHGCAARRWHLLSEIRASPQNMPSASVSEGARCLLTEWPCEGVLRLLLDRPSRHNAIDGRLLEEIHTALLRPAAKAIVLGSSTVGQFCSGADRTIADAERAAVSDGLYDLYRQIVALDVPVVAAMSGPAVGGGAQLAIACDLRVAAHGAWLRFVGPGHGLAVGAWGLPALVGRGRALDLCLTGRSVEAPEALAIGLVDRLVGDAETAALAMAQALAGLDGAAVARVKAMVARAANDALAIEAAGNRGWGGGLPPADR